MHADPPMTGALVEMLWRAAIEDILEAERAANSSHLRVRARVPVDKMLRPGRKRPQPQKGTYGEQEGSEEKGPDPLPAVSFGVKVTEYDDDEDEELKAFAPRKTTADEGDDGIVPRIPLGGTSSADGRRARRRRYLGGTSPSGRVNPVVRGLADEPPALLEPDEVDEATADVSARPTPLRGVGGVGVDSVGGVGGGGAHGDGRKVEAAALQEQRARLRKPRHRVDPPAYLRDEQFASRHRRETARRDSDAKCMTREGALRLHRESSVTLPSSRGVTRMAPAARRVFFGGSLRARALEAVCEYLRANWRQPEPVAPADMYAGGRYGAIPKEWPGTPDMPIGPHAAILNRSGSGHPGSGPAPEAVASSDGAGGTWGDDVYGPSVYMLVWTEGGPDGTEVWMDHVGHAALLMPNAPTDAAPKGTVGFECVDDGSGGSGGATGGGGGGEEGGDGRGGARGGGGGGGAAGGRLESVDGGEADDGGHVRPRAPQCDGLNVVDRTLWDAFSFAATDEAAYEYLVERHLSRYVSFWPYEEEPSTGFDPLALVRRYDGDHFTFFEDVWAEGVLPDVRMRIDASLLDVDAMRRAWARFRETRPDYYAVSNSCATVAIDILKAGVPEELREALVADSRGNGLKVTSWDSWPLGSTLCNRYTPASFPIKLVASLTLTVKHGFGSAAGMTPNIARVAAEQVQRVGSQLREEKMLGTKLRRRPPAGRKEADTAVSPSAEQDRELAAAARQADVMSGEDEGRMLAQLKRPETVSAKSQPDQSSPAAAAKMSILMRRSERLNKVSRARGKKTR